MEYSLLTAEQLPESLSFLSGDVMARVKDHSGWVVIGEEDKAIVTVVAITRNEKIGDTIELAYIYTVEEKRMEDYALGLLQYVEDIFKPLGINKIVTYPMGSLEEISDFTVFLEMADFEPAQTDWHVLQYDKNILMKHPVVAKLFAVPLGHFDTLTSKEIKYFLGQSDYITNQKLRDDLLFRCNPANSLFAIRHGVIAAAILCQGQIDTEANILNLYLHDKYKDKKHLIAMIAKTLTSLPDEVEYVNFSVDGNSKLDLYTYLFGQPSKDYWVQSWQHVYTDDDEE